MPIEPLSITAACVGLAKAGNDTSLAIISFIRTARDAREDLSAISKLLGELTLTLDLLKRDGEDGGGGVFPDLIKTQILSILKNCDDIIGQVNKMMEEYAGRTGPVRWAFGGKERAANLDKQLGAHIRGLNLAVDMSMLVAAKANTAAIMQTATQTQEGITVIQQDTSTIKGDTAHIQKQICQLQALLSGWSDTSDTSDSTVEGHERLNFVIERYLDSMTSYATSVCDEAAGGNDLTSAAHSWDAAMETTGTELSDASLKGPVWSFRMVIDGDDGTFVPRSTVFATASASRLDFHRVSSGERIESLDISGLVRGSATCCSLDGSTIAVPAKGAIKCVDLPDFTRVQRCAPPPAKSHAAYHAVGLSEDALVLAAAPRFTKQLEIVVFTRERASGDFQYKQTITYSPAEIPSDVYRYVSELSIRVLGRTIWCYWGESRESTPFLAWDVNSGVQVATLAVDAPYYRCRMEPAPPGLGLAPGDCIIAWRQGYNVRLRSAKGSRTLGEVRGAFRVSESLIDESGMAVSYQLRFGDDGGGRALLATVSSVDGGSILDVWEIVGDSPRKIGSARSKSSGVAGLEISSDLKYLAIKNYGFGHQYEMYELEASS